MARSKRSALCVKHEGRWPVKASSCQSYDGLPLFLHAEMAARVPGVSPAGSTALLSLSMQAPHLICD